MSDQQSLGKKDDPPGYDPRDYARFPTRFESGENQLNRIRALTQKDVGLLLYTQFLSLHLFAFFDIKLSQRLIEFNSTPVVVKIKIRNRENRTEPGKLLVIFHNHNIYLALCDGQGRAFLADVVEWICLKEQFTSIKWIHLLFGLGSTIYAAI